MDDWAGKQLGQYEITAVIGKGGMATVYRARQASVGRDVAIKILTEKAEPESPFMQRFEQEVRIIARLENPHILPIYDFGQVDGAPYLVMRYLDGGSLSSLIARRRLDLAEVERLVMQICSALDYAHDQGVIHRDMKPQNVLLDRQGNAYICDFGIAKLIGGEHALTRTGEAVGTPSYMAPEQWQGLSVDRQADVYALGAMIFEMLTGQVPFTSDNIFSLMYKHLHEMPPLLGSLNAGLPPALDPVVQQALAKLPMDRFMTAGELARAFSLALRGAPRATASDGPALRVVGAELGLETDVIGVGAASGTGIGRAWAVEAFQNWARDADASPIFFIAGPHGIGKSTLAERCASLLGARVLRYALEAEDADTLEPRTFVESLARQIADVLPVFDGETAADALRDALADPRDAFERQVLDPLSAEDEPIYLVLDSLEAALERPGQTILDLVRAAMENWPEALRLIVTGAPHPRLESLMRRAHRLELDPESDENREDLRSTLSTRFATLMPNLSQGEVDLNALIEKSEGNPLYLNTVFDHLIHKRLTAGDLADLPAGLEPLFADLLRRAEAHVPDAAPLTRILAAARAPLDEGLLAMILDKSARDVRDRLTGLRPLVTAMAEAGARPTWRLAHPALRYWLAESDPDGLNAAHRRIADALTGAGPEQMDEYALANLPAHLVLAGDALRAAEALLDLNFLEARLSARRAGLSLADVLDDVALVGGALADAGYDGPAELMRATADALRESGAALAGGQDALFAQLYGRLAGIPGLRAALDKAVKTRRAPWLRLLWPFPGAAGPAAESLWHGSTVLALGAPATGERWLAACEDGYLRLWNRDDGALLAAWAGTGGERGANALTACAIAPDGRLGLSAAAAGSARLWDLWTGEARREIAAHRAPLAGCALNADGGRALTCGDDKLLKLWDTRTGRLLTAFYEHPDAVRCCAFAAGGALAVSGGADGLVRVWETQGGTLRATLSGHRGAVTACIGAPSDAESALVLTGGTDGQVCLWDVRGGALIQALAGPSAPINGVAYVRLGERALVAAASDDRTVRLWALPGGEPAARLDLPAAARSCALLPAGPDSSGVIVLAGAADRTLYRWTLPEPFSAAHRAVEAHGADVRGCAFGGDSRIALTASLDRDARLWEADTGRTLAILRGHTGGLNGCALRPDGRMALTASSDKTLRLWDAASGRTVRLLSGHGDAATACAFSPRPLRVGSMKRESWLALSGSADRTLRLWDAESGAPILTMRGHTGALLACGFSPVEPVIASTASDRTARLWSLDTGEPIMTLESDGGVCNALAFSGDGRWLLLGLENGQVWRFDRRTEAGDMLDVGARAAITGLALSKDGRLLFSVGADAAVRVY
ncbi:MAG: protein kinase, partial [Anaerolineae bacterium]|nr:protein kinase [Anaerolineae bacterium]